METKDLEFELAVAIVNFGKGSKLLKFARHHGVPGGTVFLGTGTARSRILRFLELTDIRKEIVLMAAEKTIVDTAVEAIYKEFEFKKQNHGIAFTMPLPTFFGAGKCGHLTKTRKGEDNAMYNSIMVVVDRGKAELVMEAATDAGARGGTVIKARGIGPQETSTLFHIDIEPEKQIVLILSEAKNTEKITASISDRLNIGKGGNSIIFCQDVNKTYGMS